MKKLKLVFASVLAVMIGVLSVVGISGFALNKTNFASAAVEETSVSVEQMQSEIEEVLANYVSFTERFAGSAGEKAAANFIKEYLENVEGLSAKQTASIVGGVQEFMFENVLNGKYEKSQNIIFEYKGDPESENKIIIGTHYDAMALDEKGELVATEGVAGSAASVSFLMALSKALVLNGYKFNAEIVFFGAGESNNAGSNFYTNGIGDKAKENILLMINFDNVAVGENLYFYTEEVDDDFSKQMQTLAGEVSTKINKINTINLNKITLTEPNEIGLNYVHIAMISDNFSFLKNGIKTINFFAGSYSKGIVLGRREFENEEAIAYTANDNIEYITEKCGQDYILNMNELYKLLDAKFSDPNFINSLVSVQNQTDWFYMIFANQNLVFYLTVAAIILMVVIAMLIHYKLTVKAYYANIEIEFLNSVVKICENVANAEDFDEEVPAEVSKALAEDIKRDKAIRPEKSHKKKDEPKDDENKDNSQEK